ncbi:MAG: ATP-binding protein [Bacillota bacterium]
MAEETPHFTKDWWVTVMVGTRHKDYLMGEPNARKLLQSMRYLGYDEKSAICDIIDNSLDAEASSIRLYVEKVDGDFCIEVVDDGCGMSTEVLDQAVRFGSLTSRSLSTDLGRFGMGLTTAALSLGRRLHVITRAKGSPILSVITDVDDMSATNSFRRTRFGVAPPEDEEFFRRMLGDSTGTVVRITKADGFTRQYVGAFQKDIIKHLGEVYRYFLRNSVVITVNDHRVEVNDPLWLDHPKTEEWSHDSFELKFTDATGREVSELVRIRTVILPDHGSRAENRKRGYNIERAGFYVLRNNRQIAAAQSLGIMPRHPDFIRFRAEMFITGALDEVMGIEFTKRDIKPNQSIKDQLREYLVGDLKSVRKRTRETEPDAPGDLDHSAAERHITSLSKLLLKPKANVSVLEETAGNPLDQASAKLDAICKFEHRHMSASGPIYEAEQRGKTIYCYWNVDHPFYETFILGNRHDSNMVLAADYLVYSLAAAELKVFTDEEQAEFLETWKTVFSSNLRTLLGK